MITKETVRYVARLARLRLTSEEQELLAGQLDNILKHMEELKNLDTGQVPPTSHALGLVQPMRPDEEKTFPGTESLLSLAPQKEGPYFKVQKVIE